MSIDGAKYVRLFNRLEKAVSDHESAKPWTDDADDKLHAAHRAVMKAATLPPAVSHSPTTPQDGAQDEDSAGTSCPTNCDCPVEACLLSGKSPWNR